MHKRFVSLAALSFLLVACGADGPQVAAADVYLESYAADGLDLDEGCVRDLFADLTDEDAQAVADNGIGVGSDASREATALIYQLDSCMDPQNYLDYRVSPIDVNDVDIDCLREALAGLTVPEIDESFVDALSTCSKE